MEILFTPHQLNVISVKATKSMHDEFDSFGEPDLKKSFPLIPTGIVRHVQMEMVRMMVEDGNIWEEFLERMRELRFQFMTADSIDE